CTLPVPRAPALAIPVPGNDVESFPAPSAPPLAIPVPEWVFPEALYETLSSVHVALPAREKSGVSVCADERIWYSTRNLELADPNRVKPEPAVCVCASF